MKTIILGLDGATFDLLTPWARQGILPNFARLLERSAWGHLETTTPPTTPPAWACAVTGKNPGKHGIFDFRESFYADPHRPLISSRSIRARRIWNILNGHGKRTIVVNLPIIYPPEKVDGIMISGMMTPSPDVPYTHPPELKEKLLRAIGDYVVNVDIPKYDVDDLEDAFLFFTDITHSFEKRKEAFYYLLDTEVWDFFMIVFILPDRIQHLFWKYIDPESRFYRHKNAERIRDRMIGCYRTMDVLFGELLKKLSPDTNLFVMSDHGFGSTHAWINVNRWLQDQGLLALRGEQAWKKDLFMRAMAIGESPFAKAVIPRPIQRAVRRRVRGTRGTLKSDILDTVDWSRTKAFFASIACQGIYINVHRPDGQGIVSPGREYDALREMIREKLLALTDPATGERVVDRVQFREEIYAGQQTALAPDIFFVARDYGYLGRQHFGTRKWIETSERTPNGFHRMNGVFMALGPQFRTKTEIRGAHIMDVTPTVLYSMGLPIPDDMDGKVLTEIFPEEHVRAHPPQFEAAKPLEEEGATGEVYSSEEDEAVRDQLKSLGYIE